MVAGASNCDLAVNDLDVCTRAAYELGLRRSFHRAETKPYSTANGNNDIPQMVHAGGGLTAEDVRAILERAGVAIESLVPIHPTLEDVFIALTGTPASR